MPQFTIPEFAKLCNCTRQNIDQKIKRKKLKTTTRAINQVVIVVSDIELEKIKTLALAKVKH